MQTLLQEMGIDSRLTRGAAVGNNDDFRGHHMWLEVTLPNGRQLLVDPTWNDVERARTAYQNQHSERPLDVLDQFENMFVVRDGDDSAAA